MPDSKPKPPGGKPFMDVARPGKSAPSATSKSIIVNNRPIMKDPMMTADETAPVDTPAAEETQKVPSKIVITPLSDATTPKAQEETPAKEPGEPKPTPAESDKGPEATEETPASANTEPTTEPSDAPMTDQQVNEEAAAEAAHTEAVTKLVTAETYFLPINSLEKRRAKRFVLLGIVLIALLGAVWADVALDAGLVHVNGVSAPTHFFSN